MGFLQDAIAIFRKRELRLIESRRELDDVYTFLFERPESFTWTAGQYGLFTITHRAIKNGTKPFSLASAPSEQVIRITTRIGSDPSEFKKALLELKPGMNVKMSGPAGAFTLGEHRPALLIACGIGVSPIRSIVKQLEAEGKRGEDIQLLYADEKQSFVYKEELEQLADRTAIRVATVDSLDSLNQAIDSFNTAHQNSAHYFIAGPKSAVDSVSASMMERGIAKRQIKKDAFFGY